MRIYQSVRFHSVVSSLALAGAIAGSGIFLPSAAYAQTETMQNFSIPAGDLATALKDYSAETGIQLVYSSELVAGLRSPGVSGEVSKADALTRLLAGTGLTARIDGNSATILSIAGMVTGEERVLGAVRVEGAQTDGYFGGAGRAAGVNGINGSSDITATEGTGSYTSGALSIGSKAPQAMKDIPQAVSVLTFERMRDQNINDFNSALNQMPGVTLVQDGAAGSTNLTPSFYTRGFRITSIQIDGGAPVTSVFAGNIGIGYVPLIDMAQYDHVELLRGAAGLFNGYGDPSGTVNLVRKKPLDHGQVMVEGAIGSWNDYRVALDATSPLAFSGKLRGRLVISYHSNQYFYDIAKDKAAAIYGVGTYDLTPSTLITAGISNQRRDSIPAGNGLPRYENGDDLKLPRNTALALPWNRFSADTTEIFASIDQKISKNWTAKLNLTRLEQESSSASAGIIGPVNPSTLAGPIFNGWFGFDTGSRQLSAEVTLYGAFDIFGQRQEITIGANYANQDAGDYQLRGAFASGTADQPYVPYIGGPAFCYDPVVCPAGFFPPVNVFAFDPHDPLYNQPANQIQFSSAGIERLSTGQISSVAYINLRLTAFDRLHLTTGLRYSRWRFLSKYQNLCDSIHGVVPECDGIPVGDPVPSGPLSEIVDNSYTGHDFSWPPSISLSYDITKQLTALLAYNDIYINQSTLVDAELKPIGPIIGSNIEVGFKWAGRGGRLNASLTGYRIEQNGFPTVDPRSGFYMDDKGFYSVDLKGNRYLFGNVDGFHKCCSISNPNFGYRSKGIDFEVSGEALPRWQISLGYTFNRNKKVGSDSGTDPFFGRGTSIVSRQPEHLFKLWTKYSFPDGGRFGGLSIGGGLNAQSRAYYVGDVCNVYTTNEKNEIVCGGYAPFKFTHSPYAVATAHVDYRLNNKFVVSLNIDNLTDKTYYQTIGDTSGGNWYGKPRSFTLTIRGKW